MAHKKPDNFGDLGVEDLRKANEEAMAEGRDIIAKGDQMSDEDYARAEELMGLSQEYEARIAELEAEDQERADRRARLDQAFAKPDEDPAPEDDTPADEPGDADGEGDADPADNEADAPAKEEAVVASAPKRTVKSAARQAPAPEPPAEQDEPDPTPAFAIIAAADVSGYAASQDLGTMLEASKAFNSRSKGFVPGSRGNKPQVTERSVMDAAGNTLRAREFALSDRHQRFGVARVERADREFVLEERMSEQAQYDAIMAAAKVARTTKIDSLVAAGVAGGWCAPSEIVYGFLELETVSGILDIPTITSKRGGIRWTKGPDYAALAATWGFLQTETQAEAATEKTCYELECPTWDEIRLDAVGFCVTAPVLTNSAFPELTNRVLQIGATAHAHKVNASVISRISTYLGAAINWAEVGGSTSDILDAASLQAVRLRYQYAMDPNTVIEAVFPFWAKEQVRADVSRRLNIDNPLNVPDSAITAWFAVRGIRVQFVYDYQPPIAGAVGTGAGTGGWTAFPTVLEFMMFPAGAFTKLTKDVIDLDTIYDSVGLSTNVYTAAFFEEGIAVANTGASGVKVQVAVNTRGATGFPAVGAGAGVTIP